MIETPTYYVPLTAHQVWGRLHHSTRDASHWGQRFSAAVGAQIADFTERQIAEALHKRDWGFSPEDTARLMGL